ncbi:MAG: DUF3570 domain-containing protein [Rudaea sp.]
MRSAQRPSPSLSLLLAASAALTAHTPAQADETGSAQSVGYRFNVYGEDALSAPALGDPRRYEVYSQQFLLDTVVGDRNTLSVNATHEVMSGSSPWYVIPGPDNKPIQVLSGATIRDHRSAATVALTQDAGGNDTRTVSASYSQERDYHSAALGAERTLPLSAALTLGFGGSFSHDVIEPTDAALYDRIHYAEKNTLSAFASLSWVLNRTDVVESGLQLDYQSGYLSDPYKLVAVGDALDPDSRPHRRSEAAWLVRYRSALTEHAALHLDTRLAANSWGQHSLTLEASWYQGLRDGWQLVPGVRYYSQSRARFYAPFFAAGSATFFSSDYRLGAFGALAANLNLRKRIGRWEFSAGAERYHATTSYALGGAALADPATLSYTRVFAGLDYHFD